MTCPGDDSPTGANTKPTATDRLDFQSNKQSIMRTIDLTDLVNSISERCFKLEAQERFNDCDALFSEFSEWFVTGSDADHQVISLPYLGQS